MDQEKGIDGDAPEKRDGYPYSVWNGIYIGGITVICQHLIFSFLMFSTTIWSIVVFYVLPIPILIYYIHKARITRNSFQKVDSSRSNDTLWFIWSGFLVYQSALWGIQSIFKQAIGLSPKCDYSPAAPYNDDSTDARWFPTNNYQSFYEQSCTWSDHKGHFYSHALVGPFVLMTGCFCFFKFSRGVVWDISYHKLIGRIHNVLVVFAGLAAISLSLVTATPPFITTAFFILTLLWVPSALLGWYFIRGGNINQHKRWMTRNFACTCGAITLRFYNLIALGQTPYWIMVWLTVCHLPVVDAYLQYVDDCDRKYLFGFKGAESGIDITPTSNPLK